MADQIIKHEPAEYFKAYKRLKGLLETFKTLPDEVRQAMIIACDALRDCQVRAANRILTPDEVKLLPVGTKLYCPSFGYCTLQYGVIPCSAGKEVLYLRFCLFDVVYDVPVSMYHGGGFYKDAPISGGPLYRYPIGEYPRDTYDSSEDEED